MTEREAIMPGGRSDNARGSGIILYIRNGLYEFTLLETMAVLTGSIIKASKWVLLKELSRDCNQDVLMD